MAATALDRTCIECHQRHNFHHASGIAENVSCLSCHAEHQGDPGLHARSGSQCAHCHGSTSYLIEHARITRHAATNNIIAPLPGFVTAFSKDHPEFDILRSGMPDTNTLRFNHQLHLSLIVTADGAKLQCASCHEQDAAGAYHRPIRFEQHCQSCHSLQFDEANPNLQLPHGEVRFVEAFVASLPEQYERFGREFHKITERRALAVFVQNNMRRMQEAQLSGENLRQKIFFNRDRTSRGARIGTLPENEAAAFYGCAYCHEVDGSSQRPEVALPSVPQRWLARGSFHHWSHQSVACVACHNVEQSNRTSDVLLPGVKSCTTCHNAKAAPGESCVVCHDYHRAQR